MCVCNNIIHRRLLLVDKSSCDACRIYNIIHMCLVYLIMSLQLEYIRRVARRIENRVEIF